jgi:RNA polymerase sigma-70 factor (ECF subfamily)
MAQPANLSDEQLMARVAQEDSTALELLYHRYAPMVMGVVIKILQDRAAAEEVVQETFWRVWDKADTFQAQRGSFTSWMFSIARRLAIDVLRRRKARPQLADNETQVETQAANTDPGPDVADQAWLGIQRQQVQAAMAQLSPEQYEVIEMAYFGGLTRQEIAAATGNPLGTIHTRARLGLMKLRTVLQAEGMEA